MSASVPPNLAEARFRTLIDHLGAIVWEAVPGRRPGEARFTFVSDGTETLLGYPPARWLEDPGFWLQAIHPDDRERVQAELGAAVRTQAGADLAYRCLTTDGREVWLRTIVRVLAGGDGLRMHGVVVDVTERHLADARLERLQELSDALSGMLTATEVATLVAEQGRRAVPAAAVGVLLRAGDDALQLAGYDGYAGGVTTDDGRVPLDAGAAAAWPAFSGRGQFETVALEHEGRLLGAIALRMPADRPLAPADRVVLGVLARTAVQALLRAEVVAAERGAVAVLDTIITTAPEGFALFDTDLRYVRINQALAEINGVPAEAHVGRTLRELLPDVPSAGHEQPLRRVLATGEPVRDLEVTGWTPGDPDREHTWLVSYYPVHGTDGTVAWLGAFVVDITGRKREEERAQALAGLATSLYAAATIEERLELMVDAVAPAIAETAAASLYRPDGSLEPVAVRGAGVHAAHGSTLVVPMTVGAREIGRLEIASLRGCGFDRAEEAFAREVARRSAVAIDNARLADAERLARERTERQYAVAAALAEALTPADVATAILSEVVDAVGGEHGTAWKVSDDGLWLELIGRRGFSAAETAGHERVSVDAERPVADAIRRRTLLAFGTAAEAEAAYPVFAPASFARAGMHSVLVVPLLSLGRAVGGLLLASAREHAFGPDERALAGALAAQAGQALERARLFEAERQMSVTLQRALLPSALPEVDGLEVALRYEPATGMEAGGDFYEALPLADGTIVLAVGDVVGRGAAAAAAMGQLRSALRAFAMVGDPPGAVLTRLSAFADTVGGAMASTAVVVRMRPGSGELRYACAGHPWPLLVHPDGSAEFLREGRGVPLACVAVPEYPEGIAHLRPGSTLLLYTDGLTERRGVEVETVLARLGEAGTAAAGRPIGELLERVFTGTGASPPADDVALVAVRRAGGDGSQMLRFPAVAEQVPETRAAVRSWLAAAGVGADAAGDILLAAGEAVANAVEHSGTDEVTVELTLPEPGVVSVVVLDRGVWKDPVVAPHRGRGFGLMRMLIDDVAVERTPEGTVVRLRHRFAEPAPVAARDDDAAVAGECTITVADGVARLTGELDLACAARIRDRLWTARPHTVDLGGVTFLDSTGARMLLEIGDLLDAAIAVIAPAGSPARRTLDLSGLTALLDVRDR